jgi:hypothetical protein
MVVVAAAAINEKETERKTLNAMQNSCYALSW